MDWNKTTRVVVIGAGFVGSSYAFAMLNQGVADEIVLIDLDRERAEGDAMDLNHGLPFTETARIWQGDYADCESADIVVITAGANQEPGETRMDLAGKNAKVFQSIVQQVTDHNFGGLFLVATNPVDVLTYATWKYSGFPSHRVIGSGTILDTARFRYLLGEYFNVDARNVHAHIMGEHGDTELPVWSHADIGGRPVRDYVNDRENADVSDLDDIFVNVRDAAYHVIQRKGATYYGIAMSLVRLTRAMLRDENAVLTISAYLDGEYGEQDIYTGVPAVVNASGVREVIELDLDETEKEQFRASNEVIRTANQTIFPDEE
ncbi:L-lactate dehydrogenase [Salsuginibacillus halophilus]|uniref:L-lactate dehydrogenase n=1 Tax=Salsuginibacillus halophilus TaxID=517424 RepID=A0A2P8HKY0_9BACI|nr:L-lactate dehydrogenase [Salsuginibacillus halophilus]PSL46869.1 L-lactate dehydrogenase [Salsuginibacillus halophilus]